MIDDLTRLQGHIKSLIAMKKKVNRLSEKSYQDMTPRQIEKNSAELNWTGMEIDKAIREAHSAAVDLGIADPRPASHYEPVDYHPSGWHHYRHTPTKPKCME